MPKILAYFAPWHIGKSAAAQDVFVEPLRSRMELEIRVWDDTQKLPAPHVASDIDGIVFFQVEPPREWLEKLSGRIVWVPMWDAVSGWPPARWQKFPNDLRIISFSKHIAARAEAAALRTFQCQYFMDPSACPATRWEGERVAFYWNRRGLVGTEFLRKFCAVAKVDRLLYRDDVDPILGAEHCRSTLPDRLGRTIIEPIPWMESRADYNKQLNRAQIFIAPRDSEGVGIAFLEMMARGCAVVAFDAPTMNEYITSGINGVLLPNFGGHWLGRMNARLSRKAMTVLATLGKQPAPRWTLISETQDWRQLARLDFPKMGQRARNNHVTGFAQWQDSVECLAKFVVGG